MIRWTVVAASAAFITVMGTGVGLANAVPSADIQCARSVSLATQALLRADARFLNRCLLATQDDRRAFPADTLCAALRTKGKGIDQRERKTRRIIQTRCRRELPAWLPVACNAPGSWLGRSVNSAADLAECAVRSTHCAALTSVGSTFDNVSNLLGAQNSANLTFEYSESPGNTLAGCFAAGPVPTTTTSTLPSPGTTVPMVTTTMPAATTTTLGQSTTTTVGPTTTTVGQATTTTTIITPATPTLVITEFMSNPAAQSDSAGEYFEVFNAGAAGAQLEGLTVADLGSDSFTIDLPLTLPAGGYAVFAKSATAADGLGVFVYASRMSLTNSADAIVLSMNGVEIDRVVYDSTFPLTAGAATELDRDSTDTAMNDNPTAWCDAQAPMADGDSGTPGSANRSCAP